LQESLSIPPVALEIVPPETVSVLIEGLKMAGVIGVISKPCPSSHPRMFNTTNKKKTATSVAHEFINPVKTLVLMKTAINLA